MANVSKIYNVSVDGNSHYLTEAQGEVFCLMLSCVDMATTDEIVGVNFQLEYTTGSWIRLTREGDTFIIEDDEGNNEPLDQGDINELKSQCSSYGGHRKSCGCAW